MTDELNEVKLDAGGQWVDGNGNPADAPENADELRAAWEAEQAAAEAQLNAPEPAED